MLMPLCCPALGPTFRNRDKSSRNRTGESHRSACPIPTLKIVTHIRRPSIPQSTACTAHAVRR